MEDGEWFEFKSFGRYVFLLLIYYLDKNKILWNWNIYIHLNLINGNKSSSWDVIRVIKVEVSQYRR